MTHPVVDVEQSEQYYEFIVGTLDRKGDFKIHEDKSGPWILRCGVVHTEGHFLRGYSIYGRYALWFV